jgi:hypothetical protein
MPPSSEPAVIYIQNLPGDLPEVLGGGASEAAAGFFDLPHTEFREIDQG